jgi:hypothetical protein
MTLPDLYRPDEIKEVKKAPMQCCVAVGFLAGSA